MLVAQLADSAGSRDNVQAYSDFRLATDRPYNIVMRYSHTEVTKEFRLYIDGVEQTVTDGNPMTLGIFDSHSGSVNLGNPDNNLEMGTADIGFDGKTDCYVSDFCSWSDNSAGTNAGALDKTTEIRDILYRRGALPDDTIVEAAESAMQTALDATADTRPDWPLSYRIETVTGGGDLELVMNDKDFDPGISSHVEYRGADTLTLVNVQPGSNLDSAKCWSLTGGTVTVVNAVATEVTTKDGTDLSTITDASRVLVTAATGGDLPFEDSVTITRAITTATVTHTAHGLRTGLQVVINGAAQNEYNGIQTITVTDANTYTYTLSGSPTTPATGTIEATSVIMAGLTTAGILTASEHRYTTDQPVTIVARKGSGTPYYEATTASGTITSAGLTANVFMLPDE